MTGEARTKEDLRRQEEEELIRLKNFIVKEYDGIRWVFDPQGWEHWKKKQASIRELVDNFLEELRKEGEEVEEIFLYYDEEESFYFEQERYYIRIFIKNLKKSSVMKLYDEWFDKYVVPVINETNVRGVDFESVKMKGFYYGLV